MARSGSSGATAARSPLPSKVDNLAVRAGRSLRLPDRGAGGWGDPLERPADRVAADVRVLTVTPDGARDDYGVVVTRPGRSTRPRPTEAAAGRLRYERGDLAPFDFGDPPGRPERFDASAVA